MPKVNAGVPGTVILALPTNLVPLVVYAAAAASIERYPGGNNNAI